MEGVVAPGDRLGRVTEVQAGAGTYVRDQHVHASLVGLRVVTPAPDGGGLPTVSVARREAGVAVPFVGCVVTAKVTKINPRFAQVQILCVGRHPVKESFSGVIRKADIRAHEVDKVEVEASFRPGDVVRAEVISLGGSRSYFLSTAKNELGVVAATSEAGHPMVPISWEHMQCPVTLVKESRKVAKLVAEEQ